MRQFRRKLILTIFVSIAAVSAAGAQQLNRAFTIAPGGRVEVKNLYGRVDAFTETAAADNTKTSVVTAGPISITATSTSSISSNDVKIVANGGVVRVEVDPADPAFANPTKYVGPFFTREQARSIGAELGWLMKEDGARGWRHVVPSPKPKHICDISLVKVLAGRGTIVIAGGGGGIPVVREANGVRNGVEAVIDKDMTSALMANVLGIDTLMILTAVPKVAIDFAKPTRRDLDRVTLRALKAYHAAGHFPPGSMGPKIEATIAFMEGGGKRVIIARLDDAMPALEGRTGTHVYADDA